MLWSNIPSIAIASDTSDMPLHDIGTDERPLGLLLLDHMLIWRMEIVISRAPDSESPPRSERYSKPGLRSAACTGAAPPGHPIRGFAKIRDPFRESL